MAGKPAASVQLLEDCENELIDEGAPSTATTNRVNESDHVSLLKTQANIAMTTTTITNGDINLDFIAIDSADSSAPSIVPAHDPDIDDDVGYESEPLPLARSRSLSDVLSRSAPVLFIKNHGKKMVGMENPTEDGRDHSWTNWMVGVSCACFLFPSFTILALRAWTTVRRCIIFDCCYFVLVALVSFLSDYVYCYKPNPPCKFVTFDQWTATGGVVVAVLGIVINPYPIIIRFSDLMVLLVAIYFIGKSRKADTAEQW
eukprot:CAMPEP_0197038658 /NCGR_PEP_ID=MMETSP1384-20130603/15556_1 /TAXON_ID=29189 /ORGANISM="Ammonia sp." /LENGTH=257 /DNA_ID=CAMNT_0042469121 /DNA_START=28 /DNA_END=798 /DNA_ORIENTATION=-